ncbi:TEPSIN isoform 3 [Pan troglodytes]|uniref:TEPSIN isoform 3 n=1 Tax=Pan troglodytes TaxID=9598 RepID=A0A2J8JGE9_PANTR|nr:TEPSIN isoform 3 [Pan troglodytes]
MAAAPPLRDRLSFLHRVTACPPAAPSQGLPSRAFQAGPSKPGLPSRTRRAQGRWAQPDPGGTNRPRPAFSGLRREGRSGGPGGRGAAVSVLLAPRWAGSPPSSLTVAFQRTPVLERHPWVAENTDISKGQRRTHHSPDSPEGDVR